MQIIKYDLLELQNFYIYDIYLVVRCYSRYKSVQEFMQLETCVQLCEVSYIIIYDICIA